MDTNLYIQTIRLASVQGGSLRTILARILSARINVNDKTMDMWARACMAEGLAGKPEGTYSRNPRSGLAQAAIDIPASRWASPAQHAEFFGDKVVGLRRAVVAGITFGIRKAPHWFGYGSQAGSEEDIMQSLEGGITLAQQTRAKGGNIYRRTGLSHKGTRNLQIRGLMGALKNNAANAVTSLIRSRNPDARLDAPVSDAKDSLSLVDLLEDSSRSRDVTDILRNATPALKRKLNDSQFRLWEVVLTDPDIMSNDARGISTTKAERIHQRLYGESPSGSYLGKMWKKMLPTVLDELEDALVGWAMATRRRASASRVASRYLEACGDTPCATCEGCGCGGQCDGRCQNKEASSMDLESLVLDNDNILSSLESQIDALEAVI